MKYDPKIYVVLCKQSSQFHLIARSQLPEDVIAIGLIAREEAKPQFCIGRVAFAAIIFTKHGFPRWMLETPPCCRGTSQEVRPAIAIIVGRVPGDPVDGFPAAAGIKL